MIWAKHRYGQVQHIGVVTEHGLSTLCNSKEVTETNRPLWDYQRSEEQYNDRRMCILCVGHIIRHGDRRASTAIFQWVKNSLVRSALAA